MKKVLIFSLLLVGGLAGSQLTFVFGSAEVAVRESVRVVTMLLLSFIMIHVGYEFEIDKKRLRQYGADYGIAATAAAFPWIFASLYFVYVLMPGPANSLDTWKDALLAGRFAAPTSAGVLFSMLAAAGLSATWMFRKARILAIFDDLDTVLLMIPLKMLIVGIRWQLAVIIVIMGVLVWMGWKWMRAVNVPVTWFWVLAYAGVITLVSEMIYRGTKLIDDVVPVHIEVLLPAFVVGMMLARPASSDPHADDAREGHQEGPEAANEQLVSTIISGAFMVFVGLSMPVVRLGEGGGGIGLASLIFHTLVITVLANLGKMFPLLVYRDEATLRDRLALCVGMWPRGEVGAGILVVSLGYGIAGPVVAVAGLSLALNLVLTGVFILIVKRLLREQTGTRDRFVFPPEVRSHR